MAKWKWLAGGALVLTAAVVAGVLWLEQARSNLPPGIALGNGRLETEEVDIATKYAGRVADVRVEEGDVVAEGDLLARIDTEELAARLMQSEAELRQSREARRAAAARVRRWESECVFAQQELSRALRLFEKGHVSEELVDERRNTKETADAECSNAKAQLQESIHAIEASEAATARIGIQISEHDLTAPISGRVQYRLAEPGEVLPVGGKLLTLLDLNKVYMTIFLPAPVVGRVAMGAEARIVLDAAPELVIPATVTFVSAEAQFTPKTVETQSEREKLMFRVKVTISPELLSQHMSQVKAGLPGVAYVRYDPQTAWPDRLQVKLPE